MKSKNYIHEKGQYFTKNNYLKESIRNRYQYTNIKVS